MKNKKTIQNPLVFILIASSVLGCSQISPGLTPTVTLTSVPQITETPPTVEPVDTPDSNAGSSGIGDSLYPGLGNGGYDVTHYTLDITVNDVASSNLKAITTLEAKATQELSSFNLDFMGFEIMSITVNEQTAGFVRNGQELTIIPAELITENRSFTVVVEYNGSPSVFRSMAIPVQTGWVTFEGGSFVLSEPDGAATFYPVNDHPLDKALFTFRVTVPKPFEVAANGVLIDTVDNGDTTTFLFESRDPMASYLATINIDEFNIETEISPSDVPIRNYFATDLPEGVNEPFARQGEMLEYFGELFGPYPFEVYGSLVLDTYFGAALENQTMSIYGMDMIDLEDVEGTELVVAHEMAHQWFGDSVSLADWSDIWLNEGFADYSEGLWIEHTRGREALDEWVKSDYTTVVNLPEYFPPPGNPRADNLFNGGVYVRGGLTLHALRLEVGDKVFFDILRTYAERYKYGNVTTEGFIAVAEEVSGKELTEFFDSWLNDEKMPPIPEMGLGTE